MIFVGINLQLIQAEFKKNLSRKIYLTEIAGHCGLSVSHFSLLFKKSVDRSPMDFLNHLLIQYACKLLDIPGLKVKEVAEKAGFDDVYYFSRIFSRIMERSPSHYRKTKKG